VTPPLRLYLRCARCEPDIAWNGGEVAVLADEVVKFVDRHTGTGCNGPFVLVDAAMRERDLSEAFARYVEAIDDAPVAVAAPEPVVAPERRRAMSVAEIVAMAQAKVG
jgi:hypothetical protein